MARLITWLVSALLLALVACQQEKTSSPPDHLIGTWRTSDPKYAARYLNISHDTIVFGVGGDESHSYRITDTTTVLAEDHFLYTISYVNEEGQRYKLSLIYEPHKEGVIRLKNRKQYEWKKQVSRR